MNDQAFRPAPPRWWTGRRLAFAASLVVGILGIGAIVWVVVGPAKGATPAELAASFTQKIEWEDCGDGFDCASIAAPVDWSDEDSDAISLALIKHPATGTRHGTLVVDPGGPGGSGVDMVGSGVENAVTDSVARHFDVIGFDPRGVGNSTPVRCGGATELDRYLYGIPPGQIGSNEWIKASRSAAKRFASECAEHTGRLLENVDTTSVARDLDLIRADLGEKKLDYLGYSWGTYLGTLYAGLFPQHVGRFVFDGADDPWFQSSGGGDTDQAGGFDDALTTYLAACTAGEASAVGDGTCPFHFDAQTASGDVETMLATVQATPLAAKDGRRLGGFTLATAISEALYDTRSWPELTRAFAGVQKGDPKVAFELADEYNGRTDKGDYADNSTEVFDAVSCLESPGDDDVSSMRKDARALVDAAPVLGLYQAYSGILCAQWPTGVADFPAPVIAPGSGPILIVGTTGDPATPYADAVALSRQLANGHLLKYVGEGHTAYDLGHDCVDSRVDAFLLHGTIPAAAAACR